MQVILLGSGGYHPTDARHTACVMLPEVGVVLDAGTAMYRVREHIETSTLDIFLSHAHLDHVVGLTFLFDIMWKRPLERVTVHAEAAKCCAIDAHLFSKALFPARPPFHWAPLEGPVELPRRGRLTYFKIPHPGGAIGYRLDWSGHSMAYVTDTTARPDSDYIQAIQGVDLLIHECYFTDDDSERADETGHSWLTPVAQVARAADVGRLVMVHVNPLAPTDHPLDLPRARSIFEHCELAVDNMKLEF